MKIIIFNNRKFSKKKIKNRKKKKAMKRVVFSNFIILFVKIRKKEGEIKIRSKLCDKEAELKR